MKIPYGLVAASMAALVLSPLPGCSGGGPPPTTPSTVVLAPAAPLTFYASADQLLPFEEYGMEGRTYRYLHGPPVFPFGHGLSSTTFAYGALDLPSRVGAGEEVRLSVEVENTGSRAGEEVVQLYLTDVEGERVVKPGWFEVSVGGKQPGFSGVADAATTGVITGRFQVTGESVRLPR